MENACKVSLCKRGYGRRIFGRSVLTHAGLLGSTLKQITGPSNDPNWTLDGESTMLIPVPAATPVGIGACPGVRPGAIARSDAGVVGITRLSPQVQRAQQVLGISLALQQSPLQ